MKPIEFKEQTVVLAKDQPQYLDMPVHINRHPPIQVTSCWKLSFLEKWKFLFTGRLWLSQMTFGRPVQPIRPAVDKPDLPSLVPEFQSIGSQVRDPDAPETLSFACCLCNDTGLYTTGNSAHPVTRCPVCHPDLVNPNAARGGKRKADVTAHLEEADHGDEGDRP